MEDEYYEITSELDARDVLRYLNYLGIHNISGEVLKYFITDLKKLIKYDLQHREEKTKQKKEQLGPERLHSASTFSSRIRSKVSEGTVRCSKECQRNNPLSVRNTHSAPNLGPAKLNVEQKVLRRACSCVRVEKKSETTPKETRPGTAISSNFIRVPQPQIKKKSDPVSLYHYYTSLWDKYKTNVPGENDWADLRWSIRQKMAGLGTSKPTKGPDIQRKGHGKK